MVNFNFSFDPGTSLQQMIGFETAGRIWSSYLTDPITVNLQVGVSSSLGTNVIGGALPGMNASQSYSSFTNALKVDATSIDDQTALRQVFGSSFSAAYKVTAAGITYQSTGTSSSLNLTRAHAKALGLPVSGDLNGLDGYILFGSLAGSSVQWNYDYTRSAATPANSLDFLSTALHEIGHVLGFVSGLDSSGWLDTNFGTDLNALLSASSQLNAITTGATPLDLFRYSTNVFNLSDTRDLSLGGTKAFTLGSLSTPIANFSTSTNTSQGGNGYEASHWYTNTNAIMAPTLKMGTRSAIAAIDLKAFDVIGWNLAPNGINTTINLATLQSQAQQSLASRLGQTVSWLNANSTTAAQQLAKDNSQAIYTMAAQSQIYDLSRITPASLTYSQLFQEQGLFETIDELVVLPAVNIQPSLETLIGNVTSHLSRITPPTTGGTPTLIINLPSLDLSRITPPTTGGTPAVTVNLSSSLSQSVQPLTTATATTATSNSLLTVTTNYFYGSSKPIVYEGTNTSAQQMSPLSVLIDLTARL
ncbi:MAG: NF038122 family metalloprotease [Leptolyngbya sp. BL-A-14]